MVEVNRVYVGDCLEIMRGWNAFSVDIVIADPPYMINVSSAGNGKLNPWADLYNGALWYSALYKEIRRVLKPDGVFWTFLNWRTLASMQKAAWDSGWDITSLLVWDKEWIGPGGTKGLRPSYELVALFCNGNFSLEDRGIPDIKRCQWSSQKPTGHPAEKPVALVEWLLEISGDGIVLDPFLGSGTLGVATEKNNRKWIGIELDPKWAEFAEKRIAAERAQLKMAI